MIDHFEEYAERHDWFYFPSEWWQKQIDLVHLMSIETNSLAYLGTNYDHHNRQWPNSVPGLPKPAVLQAPSPQFPQARSPRIPRAPFRNVLNNQQQHAKRPSRPGPSWSVSRLV